MNTENKYSHDIFVSFSFCDQQIAERIVNELTSVYGFRCWICLRNIDGGTKYRDKIPDAIDNSKIVLFIQSEKSLSSKEISSELTIAYESEKIIVPFMIDKTKPEKSFRYCLAGVDYIDATNPPIDEKIVVLANTISNLIGARSFQTNNNQEAEKLLSSPSVIPKNIFVGRDKVIKQIENNFSLGERLQFLSGIGGIGKTQIAKKYAKIKQNDYETVIYATYNGSLKDLIISDTYFQFSDEFPRLILEDGTNENDDSYFLRKLKKIKRLSNEKTLIIIDNFDTEYDEDIELLIDGKYHLLITTRTDFSKTYPTIKIEPLESIDELKELFIKNYDGYDVEEDDPDLESLLYLVNSHTYTVELLAQHMSNSCQTVKEMIDALKKEGITSLNESVGSAGEKTQVAYENLLKMFKVFSLSSEEQSILRYLSFAPNEGISIKDFKAWAGISSVNAVRKLEYTGWIVRNSNGISLHPVIKEVIIHEIPSTEENSKEFIGRFCETISDQKAWHYPKHLKDIYASVAEEIIKRFPVLNNNTLELYRLSESLFSFGTKPVLAIELAERLFEYYKNSNARDFEIGRAAFKIGWAYLFNLFLNNSLDNAKKWLYQGYRILKDVQLCSSAEYGVYGQLLGNLARLNMLEGEAKNDSVLLEEARNFAELAVEITKAQLKPGDPAYPKVAGAYMHLADVYNCIGRHEEAHKLANDAYDILYNLFGESDSDTIHASSRVCRTLFYLEKYEEAESLAEKTATLYDNFYGELHFGRFEQLMILLKCYIALDRVEKARKLQAYLLDVGSKILSKSSKNMIFLNEYK